jgi:hypothetical protein
VGRRKAEQRFRGRSDIRPPLIGSPFRPTESDPCARKEVLAMYWHGIIFLFSVVASLAS